MSCLVSTPKSPFKVWDVVIAEFFAVVTSRSTLLSRGGQIAEGWDNWDQLLKME